MIAIKNLQKQYKQLLKNPDGLYNVYPNEKNFLEWKVLFFGPPDTIFENGIFEAKMTFPKDYPNSPPKIVFMTQLFHPNIYPDGTVCISILHDGVDQFGYESKEERWNPLHGLNSILISIISMFASPNFESPANVDASKMWREDFNNYKKIVYKTVSDSLR
jgi:ubiquitin-protein ligase